MYAGSIIHNSFVCIHFVNSQLEYFNSLFGRNCETSTVFGDKLNGTKSLYVELVSFKKKADL